MNKLGISKEVLENFSIDSLKNLGGCAPAAIFLKQKYGDKVKRLIDCQPEIIELIVKDGKAEWVINFFLNLLQPHHRVSFYSKKLIAALSKIDDKELRRDLDNALVYFSQNASAEIIEHLSSKLQEHLIPIESEIEFLGEDKASVNLKYERVIIQSIQFYLDDPRRKFTRSVTDALIKLAESKCCLNVVTYNYDDVIKDIAIELMEYTGIWKSQRS